VDDDLQDMLKISTSAGSDSRLVQGGGGNTSVKTDGGRRMYVKASGTSLGEMQEGQGYRLVDVEKCIAIVEDPELERMDTAPREAEVLERLIDCCVDELPGRPSVETSLHAMLSRCVVHTHPSVVNGLLCAREGQAALKKLFGDFDPPYLYIEFCGAGYSLALRMHDALDDYREEHGVEPEVIFLENHGLFVTTESADRALELTRHIFEAIQRAAQDAATEADLPEFQPVAAQLKREAILQVAAAARQFYGEMFGTTPLVRFQHNETVTDFLRRPTAEELASVRPVSPDQVVYCRAHPVWVDRPESAEDARAQVATALAGAAAAEDTPLCILVDGIGLFCAAPTAKLLEAVSTMMRAALETLSVASHFGGPRGLTEEAIQWLGEWEVERFRREVARGRQEGDELAGRVALVTGSGSGLGRGISLCLARKGAHVVLADIDTDGAEETARRVGAEQASGTARPVWVDVTSREAVDDLIFEVVRELGGLDLLVNCAGIAPAHPLVDFPLAAWQKTLGINLTGYFLMARAAAQCMIRQGTGGNIINISSKSGLDASTNNSAYNATKAGEIHLARGWALELAEHDIRVNVVCPGNVFTESRIWDEEYIQALAEKRGIRPEEVIPYYINLTALKEEITWDDIGEAVVFLAGDRAAKITGQTLVVDAGQVFVR
jgi:NAD(P)-dependent dehydrogenase (short-subunit alcohol dehydrogenase family)/rhamnose utilization protein RhaD (predicted bifunctional aldolase and dehydrogenase)